ncbi:MAG: OmpA family protein [Myxococcota bacterium]
MKAVFSLLIILFSNFVWNSAVAQNKTTDATENKNEEKPEKSSFAALADDKDKKPESKEVEAAQNDTSQEKLKPGSDADKTKLTDEKTAKTEKSSGTASRSISDYSVFPSINKNGNVGLRYTAAAATAKPWTFYLGYGMDYFSWSDFIIADANEKNSRFGGLISWGIFLPHNFEISASVFAHANVNERNHEVLSAEPDMQSALGDFLFSVKYVYPVNSFLNLGLQGFGKLVSGVGQVYPDPAASSLGAIGLARFDSKGLRGSLPLRIIGHVNLGFIYDNSYALMEDSPLSSENASMEPFYQYVVRQFAMGVSRSRINFTAGLEFPINLAGNLIIPFVDYNLNYFTDSADSNLLTWQDRVDVSGGGSPDDALSQQLTFGLKYQFAKNFVVQGGVELALDYPGYAVSPSLPVYNLFAGITYYKTPGTTAAPAVCKPKVVVKEKIKEVDKKEFKGIILGKVIDDKENPLPKVKISYVGLGKSDQSSDESGGFVSYELAPGKYKMKFWKKGYHNKEVEVKINKETPQKSLIVKLKSKQAKPCPVSVFVKSEKKNKPLSKAKVQIKGETMKGNSLTREGSTDPEGKVVLKVRPGAYQVVFKKDKYFSRSKTITMSKCKKMDLQISLKRKPKRSVATLSKRYKKISIKKRIHFKYAKAVLRSRSYETLDAVASILIEHPEVLKVRIEGHTDNHGSSSYNLKLSRKRAQAVKKYLVKQGVEASRLEVKGYGKNRPRYANISARLRRKNRRVEFKILKQKKTKTTKK